MVIVSFAVFLLLPVVQMVTGFAPTLHLGEKRALNAKPQFEWTRESLAAYPRRFEAFFNDHLGFRGRLTFFRNVLMVEGLKTSPVDDVLLGDDGWLFFGAEEELAVYQRTARLGESARQRLEHHLRVVNDWFSEQGIAFLVVVAPNKSTVYPEYMPRRFDREAGPSITDTFMTVARAAGTVTLDLREPFLKHKEDRRLFLRWDTHWNDEGALLACESILAALKELGHGGRALPDRSQWVREEEVRQCDLTIMLGINSVRSEVYERISVPGLAVADLVEGAGTAQNGRMLYRTGDHSLPDIVMYRDSFAVALLPYVAPFAESLEAIWRFDMDPGHIQTRKPDVVILEFVERTLVGDIVRTFETFLAKAHGVVSARKYPRLTGRNAHDAASWFRTVRIAEVDHDPPGFMLYGRYRDLPEGAYRATVRLRIQGARDQPAVRVDVTSDSGATCLAETYLPAGWGDAGGFSNVDLDFEVGAEGAAAVECRVEYLGGATVAIEGVCVRERTRCSDLGFMSR